jgi:hypothetical protein
MISQLEQLSFPGVLLLQIASFWSIPLQASFTHDFQRDDIPCAYPAATAQRYRFRCQEYRQGRESSMTEPAEGGQVHAASQGDSESPRNVDKGKGRKQKPPRAGRF